MLLSLALYLLSLIVLRDQFGKRFLDFNRYIQPLIVTDLLSQHLRHPIYPDVWVLLESSHYYADILPSTVHTQMHSHQVLTAKLCQADAIAQVTQSTEPPILIYFLVFVPSLRYTSIECYLLKQNMVSDLVFLENLFWSFNLYFNKIEWLSKLGLSMITPFVAEAIKIFR